MFADLKDILDQYFKNTLSETSLKDTLYNLSLKNFEWWIHTPEISNAFTRKALTLEDLYTSISSARQRTDR